VTDDGECWFDSPVIAQYLELLGVAFSRWRSSSCSDCWAAGRAFSRTSAWAASITPSASASSWRILSPYSESNGVSRYNPLGKVPALVTDDGECWFDSPVLLGRRASFFAHQRLGGLHHPICQRLKLAHPESGSGKSGARPRQAGSLRGGRNATRRRGQSGDHLYGLRRAFSRTSAWAASITPSASASSWRILRAALGSAGGKAHPF
jgi:hypothetical protein